MDVQLENHAQIIDEEGYNTFLNKKMTVNIIKRLHKEGWIDDMAYSQCMECVRKKKIMGDSIRILELPPRVYGSLSRSGIQTVDQLRYMLLGNEHPMSKRDFFDIRNLGIKAVGVILEKALQNDIIRPEEIGINESGTRNHTKWEMCRLLVQQTEQKLNELKW